MVLLNQLDAPRSAIYVHYLYWSCQWDEWIAFPSDRVQPHGTRTCTSLCGIIPLHRPMPSLGDPWRLFCFARFVVVTVDFS